MTTTADKQLENRGMESKIKELEKELSQMQVNDNAANDTSEPLVADPFISKASLKWSESFPKKKEEVIKWIESKYSDTIVVHKDAERAYNKMANDNLNVKRFCEAFNFLDTYVRHRNGSLSPEYFVAITEKTPFKIDPTGFKGSAKDYPAYYIDISEDNYSDKCHLLDLHIKYSSQSKEMFRIYFTYIDEMKKAVVGSMPDHLCMGPSDNRSRRNKA